MDIEKINEKIKKVRELSKKRNFKQNFDLIINLKNLDLKKPEHKIDIGIVLETPMKSKKIKICAVVDPGISGAEKIFDKVIYSSELKELKSDMKKIREITSNYDKFVVLANLMPVFAQILGRYLGPLNKMPSPKLGMIINNKTSLKELYEKLQKTVHLQTKKNLVLQATVGSEELKDEQIIKNIELVYETLIHALPTHQNNLKNMSLKLTMSKLEEL